MILKINCVHWGLAESMYGVKYLDRSGFGLFLTCICVSAQRFFFFFFLFFKKKI